MTTKKEMKEEELRTFLEKHNMPRVLIQEVLGAFPDPRQRWNFWMMLKEQTITVEMATVVLYEYRMVLRQRRMYKGKKTYLTREQLDEAIQK